MANFSQTITVRGEEYDFDPEAMLAKVPCENCGFMNEVECVKEGEEITFYGFSCEECGHWNAPED